MTYAVELISYTTVLAGCLGWLLLSAVAGLLAGRFLRGPDEPTRGGDA